MDEHECDKLNIAINGISLLREGFYLSSFLIQPHIFHVSIPVAESQRLEHTHSTFEVSVVLEGKITYVINSQEITLSSGDVIIIPPQQKHCWRLHGIHTVISGFMCYISGKGEHPRRQMAELTTAVENHQFHIRQFGKHEKCIREMLSLLPGDEVFIEEEVRNLQEMSYLYLFRALIPKWRNPERPSKRSGMDNDPDQTVEQIKYYVYDNLSRPIHLAELRRHLGISKDHLNRIFKKSENISIGQFIIRIKIERASKMLTTTDHDIKTVAAENGFFDLNYFCCAFKKHTGKTPTEFRCDSRKY